MKVYRFFFVDCDSLLQPVQQFSFRKYFPVLFCFARIQETFFSSFCLDILEKFVLIELLFKFLQQIIIDRLRIVYFAPIALLPMHIWYK